MCCAEVVFVLQFASGQLQHLIHFGYVRAAVVHEVNLGQVALYEFVFELTIAIWLQVAFKDIFTFVPFAAVFVFALIILLVGEAHVCFCAFLLPETEEVCFFKFYYLGWIWTKT